MTAVFYFVEKSHYTIVNSLSIASAKIKVVMLNPKHDFKIVLASFTDNAMEPHPEKFQFMVMFNDDIDI